MAKKQVFKPKYKDIIILASFDDDNVRQVLCKPLTRVAILNLIIQMESKLAVLDKPIEGLSFKYDKGIK